MDKAMRTIMYPQGLTHHATAWALDGAGIDKAEPVCPTMIPDPENPGTRWPLRQDLWLWFGAEAGPCSAQLADCLSDAERDRAARFRFAEDRWSYRAAHTGLRLLLGRLLGEKPHDIAFHTLPGGKPALCPVRYTPRRAAALQFSISHSRGLVAVALSGSPVGVDVERVRPLADMEQLVARFMAPETLAAFRAVPDAQGRMALFYRHWTLGEALVKAMGDGINQGFNHLAFTQSGTPRLTRTPPGWGPAQRWHLGHGAQAEARHRTLAA
jgi:4'-phosphopantetheinyl transferase